jgi:hypothetical protein
MKKWKQPKIEKLDVMTTKAGNADISIPDATYVDSKGKKWYSFPS